MFGFSFMKLIVLLAVIAVVLLGYRYFGSRRPVDDKRESRGRESVEDMERCPTCGDYVSARSARNCGREGCPYR